MAELARERSEIVECHRITGEDCFFMKAHLRDVEHLEELIDRFVPYGQTTTSIMQSSPVPGRGPARLAQIAQAADATTGAASSLVSEAFSCWRPR